MITRGLGYKGSGLVGMGVGYSTVVTVTTPPVTDAIPGWLSTLRAGDLTRAKKKEIEEEVDVVFLHLLDDEEALLL